MLAEQFEEALDRMRRVPDRKDQRRRYWAPGASAAFSVCEVLIFASAWFATATTIIESGCRYFFATASTSSLVTDPISFGY